MGNALPSNSCEGQSTPFSRKYIFPRESSSSDTSDTAFLPLPIGISEQGINENILCEKRY